ncbi:hypothetical protein PFAG_02897 [Plasmodium falciparum Santa Lucia]|uniref:Schizont egress antigen-1 n=1 Tax=Plasmodium falciparum Santa Lucia TaxID=478859 RepID=W7FUQ1_PLAFA|nr:hypothetical protein PFAG_02897 [Plasmodium falciparum Santa Lucia]
MMENKYPNELFCYINRYNINEIIENGEEKYVNEYDEDKNMSINHMNENDGICEYEIPFLLDYVDDSNKEDSEKNSLKSYLDDGASTILSKPDELENYNKQNENEFDENNNNKNNKIDQLKEKINIIIIPNKGVINNFEEILSMANRNDKNIEKKLNDRFYQICCKSIADINTHNLNKIKDLKKKKNNKGSLNIEHIDYGDIFLTIHDTLKSNNKIKGNNKTNLLHDSSYEIKKKTRRGTNIYKNPFHHRGSYLTSYENQKDIIYLNNLNNIMMDKYSNCSDSRKKEYSHFNSQEFSYDKYSMKDRMFLKNLYMKQNRLRDKRGKYHKLGDYQNIENYRKTGEHSFDCMNMSDIMHSNKMSHVNIMDHMIYKDNNNMSKLVDTINSREKDVKNYDDNFESYNNFFKNNNDEQHICLEYDDTYNLKDTVKNIIVEEEQCDKGVACICDKNEDVDDLFVSKKTNYSSNKKREDYEKVFLEDNLHLKQTPSKRTKINIIPDYYDNNRSNKSYKENEEDALFEVCGSLKNDDILYKDNKLNVINEDNIKEEDDKESVVHLDNDEDKKEEMYKDVYPNVLSCEKETIRRNEKYNKSLNSTSSFEKIDNPSEINVESKEDTEYFDLLIKKYEDTKINVYDNESLLLDLSNELREEMAKGDSNKNVNKVEDNDNKKENICHDNIMEDICHNNNVEDMYHVCHNNNVEDHVNYDNEELNKKMDEMKEEKEERNEDRGIYDELLENDMCDLYNLKMHDLHNLKSYDFGLSKDLLKKDIFIYSNNLKNDDMDDDDNNNMNDIAIGENVIYENDIHENNIDDNDMYNNYVNGNDLYINNMQDDAMDDIVYDEEEIKSFLDKLKSDISNQMNVKNGNVEVTGNGGNEEMSYINNDENLQAFDLLDNFHMDDYGNNYNDNEEDGDGDDDEQKKRKQKELHNVNGKLNLSDLNELNVDDINNNFYMSTPRKSIDERKDTECQTDFPLLDVSRNTNRTPRRKSVEVILVEKKLKKKKQKCMDKYTDANEDSNRRYPKRNRIKTLRYWIGERELTERNPYTGEIDVVGFSECKNLQDLSPHIIGPIEYKKIYLKNLNSNEHEENEDNNGDIIENNNGDVIENNNGDIIEDNNANEKNHNNLESEGKGIVYDDVNNLHVHTNSDNSAHSKKIKGAPSRFSNTNNGRKKRRRRKFINVVNYIKKKKKKKLIKSMDNMEVTDNFKNDMSDENKQSEVYMDKHEMDLNNEEVDKENEYDENILSDNIIYNENNSFGNNKNSFFNNTSPLKTEIINEEENSLNEMKEDINEYVEMENKLDTEKIKDSEKIGGKIEVDNKMISPINRHNFYLTILEGMNKNFPRQWNKNNITLSKNQGQIYKGRKEKKRKRSYRNDEKLLDHSILNDINISDKMDERNELLESIKSNSTINNVLEIIKYDNRKKIKKNDTNKEIIKYDNFTSKYNNKSNDIQLNGGIYINKFKLSLDMPINKLAVSSNLGPPSSIGSTEIQPIQKNFNDFKMNINVYCIRMEPHEKYSSYSHKNNLVVYIDKGEKINIIINMSKTYEKGDFFYIPRFSNFQIINDSRCDCVLYVCPLI